MTDGEKLVKMALNSLINAKDAIEKSIRESLEETLVLTVPSRSTIRELMNDFDANKSR